MSGPIVVKIGGAPLDEIAQSASLWRVLAGAHRRLEAAVPSDLRLEAAAPGTAGGLIICHGGGKSVDRQLAALGFETAKRDGVRVSPPEQIDAIVGVLAGVVNTRLVAALRAHGANAVGVTLADAGTVSVGLEDRLGPGLGCVGRVLEGNGSLLKMLLAGGYMPVVSSIGSDAEGGLLNVNADEAAEGIAACVDAGALVLLTDVAGVLDADGSVVARIDSGSAESLIASGVVRGGMAVKVRAACGAAERLGRPVRIGDVREAAGLVAGVAGVGTVIEPTRSRMSPAGV